MNEQQLKQFRFYFTCVITITISALLVWQYFNGGVPSHHLLHRADMPAISNWWGALILPLVTWILLERINKRILDGIVEENNNEQKYPRNIMLGFIFAIIYGIALSASFVNGYTELSAILFPWVLILALFFKIYREECLLGFIISMTFVFGAVLPTLFGLVVTIVAAMLYHLVHFIYSRTFMLAIRPK